MEDAGGKLYAYEFKWSTTRTARMPRSFAEAYPGAEWSVVHPENFEEFLRE